MAAYIDYDLELPTIFISEGTAGEITVQVDSAYGESYFDNSSTMRVTDIVIRSLDGSDGSFILTRLDDGINSGEPFDTILTLEPILENIIDRQITLEYDSAEDYLSGNGLSLIQFTIEHQIIVPASLTTPSRTYDSSRTTAFYIEILDNDVCGSVNLQDAFDYWKSANSAQHYIDEDVFRNIKLARDYIELLSAAEDNLDTAFANLLLEVTLAFVSQISTKAALAVSAAGLTVDFARDFDEQLNRMPAIEDYFVGLDDVIPITSLAVENKILNLENSNFLNPSASKAAAIASLKNFGNALGIIPIAESIASFVNATVDEVTFRLIRDQILEDLNELQSENMSQPNVGDLIRFMEYFYNCQESEGILSFAGIEFLFEEVSTFENITPIGLVPVYEGNGLITGTDFGDVISIVDVQNDVPRIHNYNHSAALNDNYYTLMGGGGDDVLVGGSGNDFLQGDENDDILNGTDGIDTAVYRGLMDNFSISLSQDSATLEDRIGIEGIDTLTEIETVQFLDQSFELEKHNGVSLLSEEALRNLTELYLAYFNRAPDALGLTFWGTAMVKDGLSTAEIASLFFEQPETRGLYQGKSTGDFVADVYSNVLGRAPDSAGSQFWTEKIENGSVSSSSFILELLAGAKALTGSENDQMLLERKTNLGIYFSLEQGQSDVTAAKQIMDNFDGTSDSWLASKHLSDLSFEAAISNGFLLSVEGIVATMLPDESSNSPDIENPPNQEPSVVVIEVGRPEYGSIDNHDEIDRFTFEVGVQSSFSAFILENTTNEQNNLSDPFLQLFDEQGNLIGSNLITVGEVFIGLESDFEVELDIGTYFFEASSFGRSSLGNYLVGVQADGTVFDIF